MLCVVCGVTHWENPRVQKIQNVPVCTGTTRGSGLIDADGKSLLTDTQHLVQVQGLVRDVEILLRVQHILRLSYPELLTIQAQGRPCPNKKA